MGGDIAELILLIGNPRSCENPGCLWPDVDIESVTCQDQTRPSDIDRIEQGAVYPIVLLYIKAGAALLADSPDSGFLIGLTCYALVINSFMHYPWRYCKTTHSNGMSNGCHS